MQRLQLSCSQRSPSVADEVGEPTISGGLLQLAFTSTGVSHTLIGLGQAAHQLDLAEADQRVADSRAREGQLEQASRNRRLADFIRD